MYAIETSERFLRRAGKFFRKHPELEGRFKASIIALRQDPFQPSLRLHALEGELEGGHAMSLTFDYRVIPTIKITEREIILLDTGTHDAVYRG